MARPEKPIDWKKVDDLLIAGCLGTEIAACFDMHPSTFYLKVEEKYKMGFTQYSSEKKSQGESILRAHQYAKALGLTDKGDNTLLIWLGKTRLKQKEHGSEDVSLNDENIQSTIDLAKLRAENSALKRIVNECKDSPYVSRDEPETGTEHLRSDQET